MSIVAGPGGTGKSALLRLITLLEPSIGITTPTNGTRRADQAVVDEVLPPRGYRPQLQVGTTHTSFGVGFGGRWSAQEVVNAVRNDDLKKAKVRCARWRVRAAAACGGVCVGGGASW